MGPLVIQPQRGTGIRLRRGTADAVAAARLTTGAVGAAGVVGVVTGVVACVALTIWWLPVTARVVGTGLALVVLCGAALVDAAEHRLPNRIVATALVPVLVTLAVAWTPSLGSSVLLGAGFAGVPLLATHLVTPAGMGFGDVKAGAVLGGALGLVDAQLALFALVLGLATGAVWGLTRRARSIPLGPALVAGALAALAVGRLLGMEAR